MKKVNYIDCLVLLLLLLLLLILLLRTHNVQKTNNAFAVNAPWRGGGQHAAELLTIYCSKVSWLAQCKQSNLTGLRNAVVTVTHFWHHEVERTDGPCYCMCNWQTDKRIIHYKHCIQLQPCNEPSHKHCKQLQPCSEPSNFHSEGYSHKVQYIPGVINAKIQI